MALCLPCPEGRHPDGFIWSPWAARPARAATSSLHTYKTPLVGLSSRREGLYGLADLALPHDWRKPRSHRTIGSRRNGDVPRLATSSPSVSSSVGWLALVAQRPSAHVSLDGLLRISVDLECRGTPALSARGGSATLLSSGTIEGYGGGGRTPLGASPYRLPRLRLTSRYPTPVRMR